MNEEIIFKWDRESVGKYIWKVDRQKVNVIVHLPNSTKIWLVCWRCSKGVLNCICVWEELNFLAYLYF